MKFRAARSTRVPAFFALTVTFLAALSLRAQDTATTGVRLGLSYAA